MSAVDVGDVVQDDPEFVLGMRAMVATGYRPLFPLLVKLIDVAEDLSIQVHPTDEFAKAEDSLGKTESWHILDAVPNGILYLGLRPDITVGEMEEIAREGGRTGGLLRRLSAKPNETVLIPAGHHLCARSGSARLRNPATISYHLPPRRLGPSRRCGKIARLHIDQSVMVANGDYRPAFIAPVAASPPSPPVRNSSTACRYFAVERIALTAGESSTYTSDESPQVFTCLRGGFVITADGMDASLSAGQTAAVLASSQSATMTATAPTIALRAWVPDLATDVVQPARASGAHDDAIGHLGGPLADVRVALG